jgi:hypothetical protein
MKLIKSLIIASAVALTLGASQAKAQSIHEPHIAVPYQLEPLNFSLVSTAQYLNNVEISTNGVYQSTARSQKLTSPMIVEYLGSVLGSNWTSGEKLALNNWDQNIYIVDKTGTNAVYNISQGINVGGTNVVYFSFSANDPVVEGKWGMHASVVQKDTDLKQVFFHLFVEQEGATQVNLNFYGLDTSTYTQTSTGVVTQHDNVKVTGDGSIQGNTVEINGNVTASGTWKAALL